MQKWEYRFLQINAYTHVIKDYSLDEEKPYTKKVTIKTFFGEDTTADYYRLTEYANNLAGDGWELVNIGPLGEHWAIVAFKRPIE